MDRGQDERPPTPKEARERMQRVRVGVTGLAAVLLTIALATAIASGVRHNIVTDRPSAPAAIPTLSKPVDAGADNVTAPRTEPLAQLGVSPGATKPVPARRTN